MDSYHNFVETFKQAIAIRDYESLKYVLKNIQQSLMFITEEHLQTFLSNIFDIRDGLLFFLEMELSTKSTADRHIDEALIESFSFLDFLIGNFHKETSFKNYINNIKHEAWHISLEVISEICELALRVKCSYYIQKAACNAFMNLIEKFGNDDLELNKTLIQFVKNFHVNDQRERKLIFCILGKIIKHNESFHCVSTTYIIAIYKQLYADSFSEYTSDNNLHQNFHMYFDALSDIWDCTEPPHDMKEKLSQNMYQWIKDISYMKRRQKIRIVMKSGIEFLNRHMHQFQNFLYNDYKYWYYIFRNLSCEKSTYKNCGQSALKKLYRIIGKILREQNREENNEILEFFRGEFLKEFENSDLNLTMLRLTIDGFSQMTASCKIYLSHDSKKMYSSITNCALPLCSSEQCDPECIENICCYLEALAEILQYVSNVTIGEVNVLMKLSIYIIKKFPELAISKNALVTSALLKTIKNLGYVDENLLQRYLDNIIYDGIAWSCSHTLALDAELQQELENLKQPPICYKNYLPLWTQLLNVTLYHDCEKLTQRVGNTLLNTCVKLINRLNIRVKRQENTAFSDMALAQSAENQADFRVFTNLVDLYVDVMDKSNLFFSVHTMHVFLHEIVKLSYKYPLLCGFYKLIRVTLKIFVRITEQQEDEEKKKNDLQTKELLFSYLVHILDLIPTFSNELLIACLYLILDVPGIKYVATAAPSARMIPIFKIAFTMGLSDLEFAHTALTALEIWWDCKELRKWVGRTNELLCEIMPYLESYLRSAESTVEVSQDLMRKTMSMVKVKQVNLIDTKCMLRNLQRQILLFLGSLGSDALSSLVYQRSLNTGASWDRKNLLRYTFLLPNMRLSIDFDRMLPRITALACSSSDRRTRIAACEVLHSIISLLIGKTTQLSLDREDPLYAILCPALLTLGCDSDEVVCNLFRPLMLQLMRWFSSTTRMLLSSAKSCALNSLFDGLSDDANPSLREFAGMCLAEFVLWPIKKQMSNEHETQSNVHQLIRRIKHLALHPSTRKRVAAAIAFNHLYTILREDDDIVSIYWFEMLHCFVRSMDGCDDPSIANALDHIEKVIRYKSDVLNMNIQDRKKPPEFDGTTLNHALYWMLSQCGVLDRHCRAKCMELYVNMSQYATGGSAQETTRTFVETYGIDRLNNIILKDLDSTLAFTSIDNLTALLKALDYYIWLIKEKLLPLKTLFPIHHDAREYIIFTCIKNFANQSWVLVPEKHVTTSTMTFREFEQLRTLQCKTLMAVLNFVQILLDIDNVLSESLWVESLFVLTIKCVMHPRKIGFDIKNIEMTDKLPQILETLLNTMKLRFSDTLMDNFKQYLFKSLEGYNSQLYNLDDIAQNDSCKELIQYVEGLIILKRYGILNLSKIVAFAHHATAIEQIFNFLVSKRLEKFTCKDLNAHMIEYLQALMELQILQHETLITKTLLKLISISTPLIEDITHGKYFLNTFQDVIFEYILTNVDALTLLFDELLHNNDNLAFLLELIENLLLYLQQHKLKMRIHVDNVVDVILRRFECLMDTANNVDDTRDMERLINIYGIAVHLVPRPMEIESTYKELYKWILRQLTSNCDIEHKTKILQNFFVCLIDTTGRIETKPEIVAILHTLKADKETLCPQLSVKMNMNTMKVINCFETLLRLLSTSRSVVVLRCVIDFAVATGDCLFDKLQDYLRQYYCREKFDIEHASLSLDTTYKLFMDITDMKQRFDILNVFLLPAFDFCNSTVIERFFERNICKLYTIIQCAVDGDNANCKRIIVSQIGCYKLIAIMLARVEPNKIVDANGMIVRNAGLNRIETGRELLQNLLRNGMNVRMLNINQPDCQEIVRLLHCFAYNCTLAIVNLKEEEHFYCSAFAENHLENRYIWKNIVNCDRHYKIGQTFDEYPKICETTVNIRSFSVVDKEKELASQRVHKHSYIHSYDLSTSTLNEDINAYDFNKSVLLPKSAVASNSEPIMSMTLEKDYFNKHECMPYIYSVLNRVSSLRRKGTSMSVESEIPQWLYFFVKGMQEKYDPNITLFILKIITNTADTVFKPYVKFMLPQIAEVITDYLKTHELNYIITDILEILMDWPIDDVDYTIKAKLQQLFEILIDKMLVDTFMNNTNVNKHVHNYNLSLIDVIVKKWCNLLTVPTALLEKKITSAPRAAVYFILVLLGEISMARELINGYILNFLLNQLENWEIPDETWLKCCECSGLYLKFLLENKKENDEKSEKKSEWRKLNETIFSILSLSKSSKYIFKQAKGIKTLCQVCPDVAEDYINLIVSIIATNRDVGKFYCLEAFALSIPKLKNTEYIASKLCHMNLSSILANRVSPCEKTALRIVHAVTRKISPVDLLSYIKLIIPYTTDNNTEHRKLVYDTFMSTYKEYSTNISDDVNVKTLLSICEQNLLLALLDSSQELQTHVLRFWTEETKLSTMQSKERLLAVLDMHSQCMSMDAYALLVPLLMLQLTSQSIYYNEKMFDPFHCAYENYKIPVFCRRQNLSRITPMFIDTLASQMSYTLSQNIDHNDRIYKPSHHHDPTHAMPRLRATQDPQFSLTLADHNVANTDLPAIFDNSLFNTTEYNCDDTMISSRQSQTMPCNKKFRRFLKNPKDIAKIAHEQQIQKKIQHAEMMKQENIKQKNNVKLYRNYRIGELPDIAIPHSSLIEPLQQLIKLDPLICKDITVSLVCSLMNDTIRKNDPDFYQLVIKNLKKILSNSQKNSVFNAAILEILLTLGVTDCNPQDIVKISKENNLNVLGALFLEKSLLTKEQTNADDNFFPTSSKRLKINDENENENDQKIDKWAHLASLYKSLNDVDIVLSIFHEQFFDRNVQEAAVAEANGDWKQAKLLFEKAYNQTTDGSSMSEHCLQGIFEAVNNMCEWSEIDNLVKNRTEENRVWSDAWQDWIVPYMCNAYVHMLMNIKNWTAVQEGLQNIQPWINDPNNSEHMKFLAGEDLVIFQLKSPNKANNLLNDLLDKTGEQWVRLNPLCTELGMRMLEKLQKISDIDASLKVFTHINDRDLGSDKMTALLNSWSMKTPAPTDNLIQWNKLAAYRIYFSMMFEDTYQKMMLDDDMDLKRNEIRSHMQQIGYQLRLNIIDAALKQKHRYITKKHLDYLQGLEYFPDDLQPRLMLLKAKYSSLCADLETNVYKKMKNYILSWKESHQLLEENREIDDYTKIALSEHIDMLGVLLERLSRNAQFDNEILEKNELFHEIFSCANVEIQLDDSNDLENMRKALLDYGLYNFVIHDNLEMASHTIGEHHYSVARRYYGQLTSDVKIENDIFEGFVFAILKAVYHGHHEAMHYFPYVLQHKQLLSNESAQMIFVNECAILPVWLFLRWRDLLFSHLSTSIANMIAPIIEKLAKTYPDPIAYTYHLAIEKNPALLHDDRTLKIRALLGNKMHEIELFLRAIQYVTQPELYLKYYLNEATKGLVEGKMTALESLLHKVYPTISAVTTISENNPRPGNIYKKIANYENEIRNLNLEDRNATKMNIQLIQQSLEQSLQQYTNKSKLKDYSPFLYKYLNGSIEIPGQYIGDREPMPQYHAKIMRMEPIVKIMQSLRKPIQISMIGDNGREYKFLVKFGEDLTIDHNLQQLYATMNRTLHNDVVCRQRQLAIDTYQVIPLSRSFGLIQWIENTETLDKLVHFALSKQERDQCESVYQEYVTWIANAKRSSRWIVDQYKEATVQYNKSDVTEMMKKFISQTRQSALRDTFTDISPSPESFVTLRRNFVASYATMCAAHWISGIGDRHLQNILVVVNSGRCLGIDFGHAFDAGVRASIPELTPFRLTSQILGLLQPFTQGLLGIIMTHVMRALRDNKELILACMNTFVHEPIARSSSIDNEIIRNDGEDNSTNSTWLPKRNIEIAMKKLNGIHPSFIMLEQLRETHKDEYFMRYNTIVTGIERPIGKRAAICKDYLTAAEQVECLLDQATDLNILGRMYANWKPWL